MASTDDLVMEMLAREACDLRAELVVYRELVQVALEQLQQADARQAGLSAQLGALRCELRRYTAAQVSA
jgi:hypothetical protein